MKISKFFMIYQYKVKFYQAEKKIFQSDKNKKRNFLYTYSIKNKSLKKISLFLLLQIQLRNQ